MCADIFGLVLITLPAAGTEGNADPLVRILTSTGVDYQDRGEFVRCRLRWRWCSVRYCNYDQLIGRGNEKSTDGHTFCFKGSRSCNLDRVAEITACVLRPSKRVTKRHMCSRFKLGSVLIFTRFWMQSESNRTKFPDLETKVFIFRYLKTVCLYFRFSSAFCNTCSLYWLLWWLRLQTLVSETTFSGCVSVGSVPLVSHCIV